VQPTFLISIAVGAAFGAWLRYALIKGFNDLHAHLPFGTLISNLAGGYLIGIAIAYFASHPSITQETRLFVITGFLGSLTTFSTFSAESVHLLMRAQYGWALATISAHLFGSLLMTVAGIWTVKFFQL